MILLKSMIEQIRNAIERIRCDHEWGRGDKIKEYRYGNSNLTVGVFRCRCKKCEKTGKQKFIMGRWI